MLVTDKQADIAILRTLGLTPRGVMQVFMVQGTLIGVIGTVLGVIGGIAAHAQPRTHPQGDRSACSACSCCRRTSTTSPACRPTCRPATWSIIALVALAMAFIATIYPAWRAARTAPAEALRYE